MAKTLYKHATIGKYDYRVVITEYTYHTHTEVQVRIVFKGDCGAQWRNLPWFADKRRRAVLEAAK